MYSITVGRANKCTHYCGRSSSYKIRYGKDFSILGNPSWMSNESKRDEVCDKYNKYFDEKMKTDIDFKNAVYQIHEDSKSSDVILGCYCSPARCHCDRILEEVVKIRNSEK